jgi:sigma-B regulation protein RsbU (phosphoserine phosphatase)
LQLLRTLKNQIERGRRRRKQLRQEREETEDVRVAGLALLPRSIPDVAGFQIGASSKSAGTVSGDYFDVLDLGEGKVAISIADVIGKGVPAALLMSNLQATVRALAAPSTPPSELAARLNESILRNTTRGKFVTFFFGLLDSRARTFTYTNAGHCAPILVRANGEVARLETGGAVLGVFSEWSYGQAEVALAPGDRLLLFTDGITEAEDSRELDFGEERLVELAVALRDRDAAEMKDRILERVSEFTAGHFEDDATLVVVAAA